MIVWYTDQITKAQCKILYYIIPVVSFTEIYVVYSRVS